MSLAHAEAAGPTCMSTAGEATSPDRGFGEARGNISKATAAAAMAYGFIISSLGCVGAAHAVWLSEHKVRPS
jgi:hypothetical protein